MAGIVAPLLSSFNAGELTPYLDMRVDMAKYGNGCRRMENFIPTVQGPAKRRMGSRFVAEVADSTRRTWLVKFQFSQTDAFILEFGHQIIRFYTQQGQLLPSPTAYNGATVYSINAYVSDGGITYRSLQSGNVGNMPALSPAFWVARSVYEIASPYSEADLTNSDGTFALSLAQTGDVVFITDGAQTPQKLTRLANTNWTIADAAITNGPFETVDPDSTTTVYASAETGSGITLTASTSIFDADTVGTLFLIEQKKVDGYKVWEVGKTIALNDERRSDSNVYKALNAGTTGSIKPTHLEGAKYDGDAGIQWDYLHSGYGIVRITAAAGTTATADVISRIPSQAVGLANATNKWAKSAWSDAKGYPELVTFFRERLTFWRKAKGWFSVTADFENFANREGAETVPDSAITLDITTGELNDAVWLVPTKALLVGTVGAEFAISEISTSDVFGPGNVKASLQTGHGSRQVQPQVVNDSTLMIERTGRTMRDLRYTFDSDGYQTVNLQVLSTEVLRGRAIQMAYQEEPDNVVWCACNNGELIGLTFNREQDVIGWHRHPTQGFVESVQVIPSPDGTQDQLWMIVRRTVDGVQKRYVEYLQEEWRADDQLLANAVYVDCSATYSGYGQPGTILPSAAMLGPESLGTLTSSAGAFTAGDVGKFVVIQATTNNWCRFEVQVYTNPNTVTARQVDDLPDGFVPGVTTSSDWALAVDQISGLDYLEGLTVDVLGDGATHPPVVVSGGAITLQRHVMKAQVGLPMPALLETMRIEAGAQNGTAQGKVKRIHRVIIRLFETLGGGIGPNESTIDGINYRSSADPMNQPPAVFTGDKDISFPDGYNTDARIVVVADQPLPMTVMGLMPQLETSDRT